MQILIIDGYPETARQELKNAGASQGWELFERMLSKRAPEAKVEILFPSDSREVPTVEELSKFDGMLWTGCSLCLHDHEDARVARQVELARRGFAAGVPQFGSCWAVQIAAVAAGGTVAANPKGREMGLARKISLTEAGLEHPMYSGKPPVFDAFICHLDEVVEWPEGATLLATNGFTRVQALEVRYLSGVFWGVQYHPEYTLGDMADLTRARVQALMREGFFLDPEEAERHLARLACLHEDHNRKDLAWMLGVDQDVLDDELRQCEFINWLVYLRSAVRSLA